MADPKMAAADMKDMVYPKGETGSNVVTEFLSKTAFSSPTKLDKLSNANAAGSYGSKAKSGK